MCYNESYNVLKLDYTGCDVYVNSPNVYLDLEGVTEKRLLSDLMLDGWNLRLVQNKFSNRIKFTLHKNTSKICFSYHDKAIQQFFPNDMGRRKQIAEFDREQRTIFLEKILDEMPYIISTEMIVSNHQPKAIKGRTVSHEMLDNVPVEELRAYMKRRDPLSRPDEHLWAQPPELAIKECTTQEILKELENREDIDVSYTHDYETNLPIIKLNELEIDGFPWGFSNEQLLEKIDDDSLFTELLERAESKLDKPLYKYKTPPPTEPDYSQDDVEDEEPITNVISFADFVKQISDEIEEEQHAEIN